MGELTKNCPKPMLPLQGKPKLAYTLENLPQAIDEVILIIGYLGEKIREYVGASFAARRIRYVEQKELSGTYGALATAKDLLRGKFLVLMGDDLYVKNDLERLLHHQWAILAHDTENAEQFGILQADGKGNLLSVVERPHGHSRGLVNTGAYVLQKDLFTQTPVRLPNGEYGLPQTLAAMRAVCPTRVVTADRWQPIGSPEDLKNAEENLRRFI